MPTALTAEHIARIKELADRKHLGHPEVLFDAGLGQSGKYWFCRRLAKNAASASPSLSLATMETAINDGITAAATLIAEWRDTFQSVETSEAPPLSESEKKERFTHRLRALQQVVVCSLSIHPVLATKEAELKRIVGQRLRMWERMRFDINPSYAGRAFWYPSGSALRLNEVAANLWAFETVNSFPQARLTESGRGQPRKAIESLFLRRGKAKRNLVFCQHAASAVLVDSLLAPDVAPFHDIAERGSRPGYYFLDSPLNNSVATHFLNDLSLSGMFERTVVPVDDLQIGDHVYAANNEWYVMFAPQGLWAGEHSIVTSRFGEARAWWPETDPEAIAAQETVIEGLGVSSKAAFPMSVRNIRNSLVAHLNEEVIEPVIRKRVRDYRAIQTPANSNGPRPGASVVSIPIDPTDPGSQLIWRDVDAERSFPVGANLELTVWYLSVAPGEHHFLWIPNPEPTGVSFELPGMDPDDVMANDVTAQMLWAKRHPLLGPLDLVSVVRPRASIT